MYQSQVGAVLRGGKSEVAIGNLPVVEETHGHTPVFLFGPLPVIYKQSYNPYTWTYEWVTGVK